MGSAPPFKLRLRETTPAAVGLPEGVVDSYREMSTLVAALRQHEAKLALDKKRKVA